MSSEQGAPFAGACVPIFPIPYSYFDMPTLKQRKKQGIKKGARSRPVKPNVLANNVSPGVVRTGKRRTPKATLMRHVHHTCSITNPFCPAARGAKWPDGTTGNTMTQQLRGNVIMRSDANGYLYMQFCAAAPFGYLETGAITGGGGSPIVATTKTTYTTYASTSLLATYANAYRVVSAGCIVRCVASATDASGVATFGTSGVTPTNSAITLGLTYYQECAIKAIQPGLEFSWIAAPLGTTAHEFSGLSTGSVMNNDWTALTIEISGAKASTNLLNVEYFINVEFTLSSGQAIAQLASPNPPQNTIVTSSHSKIQSTLGTLIEGGVSVVESKITNAAKSAIGGFMEDPLEALAGLFL